MPERSTTYQKSLYDKRRREIKFDILFGAVSAIVMLILAVAVFVSNFVFIKVYVEGSSMYPTIQNGEVVAVNTYRTPNYGDVIVIEGEKSNGDWLIKRAIAFGGDTVKIDGGYVYLKKAGETEFTKLNEPYLAQGVITPSALNPPDMSLREWEIEENCVFYLGDNRTNSADSRSTYGTCEKSQVVGVVSEFSLKIKDTFIGDIRAYIHKLFGTNNKGD